MLTIFSIPKPFENPKIAVIQRNAIKSWTLLNPKPEIFLFGNEAGIAEIAREFNLHHRPEIKKNEYGTPFLHNIFNAIQNSAQYDTLCYVNCDIILFQNLHETIHKITFSQYLLVGQRLDMDITENLEFSKPSSILENAEKTGKLHDIVAMDYFVFKKDSIRNMPPFLVGRPCWDNWMIYNAKKNRIPVINTTESLRIIHQNHDYAHVKNSVNKTWLGPESEWNHSFLKQKFWLNVEDCDYYLKYNGLVKKEKDRRIRKIEFDLSHPVLSDVRDFLKTIFISLPARFVRKLYLFLRLRLLNRSFTELNSKVYLRLMGQLSADEDKKLFEQSYNQQSDKYVLKSQISISDRRKLNRICCKYK